MHRTKPVSRISSLREEMKLTQRELAELMEVTENTIANWEKGRSSIEWIDRVIRLCKIFECSPEELVEYVPELESSDSDSKEKSLAAIRERLNPRSVESTATNR